MNNYPVTLDEFKLFFMRDAGLEYQPFPSWVKTVWDTGDWCLCDNIFYKSLIDLNHTIPTEDSQDEPTWQAASVIYEEGQTYPAGTVVYYNGYFYTALEETGSLPFGSYQWILTDLNNTFPKYRDWATPIAYSEGAEVVAIINFRPVVMKSNAADNYTNPAVPTVIEDTATTSSPTYYWEEDDDETADLEFCVLDSDILRAMGEATFKFNQGLFTKDKGKMIFLYLTMFFLVYDRQMGAAGLNGNSAAGPVIHRTVGKMTVSYMESKLFSKYPSYEFLASNDYGRKAFNLMRPYLTGGVQILQGASTVQ